MKVELFQKQDIKKEEYVKIDILALSFQALHTFIDPKAYTVQALTLQCRFRGGCCSLTTASVMAI